MTAYNGKIYFRGRGATSGHELWSWDETAYNLEADIYPGPLGATLSGVTNDDRILAVGNKLFFPADDANTGVELWQYNISTSTASPVADIAPGSLHSYPSNAMEVNGIVYFSSGGPNGIELHSHDTATGITAEVVDFSGSGNPGSLVWFNNKIYFGARNHALGRE